MWHSNCQRPKMRRELDPTQDPWIAATPSLEWLRLVDNLRQILATSLSTLHINVLFYTMLVSINPCGVHNGWSWVDHQPRSVTGLRRDLQGLTKRRGQTRFFPSRDDPVKCHYHQRAFLNQSIIFVSPSFLAIRPPLHSPSLPLLSLSYHILSSKP